MADEKDSIVTHSISQYHFTYVASLSLLILTICVSLPKDSAFLTRTLHSLEASILDNCSLLQTQLIFTTIISKVLLRMRYT
jgi:hypothetical protein